MNVTSWRDAALDPHTRILRRVTMADAQLMIDAETIFEDVLMGAASCRGAATSSSSNSRRSWRRRGSSSIWRSDI